MDFKRHISEFVSWDQTQTVNPKLINHVVFEKKAFYIHIHIQTRTQDLAEQELNTEPQQVLGANFVCSSLKL